MSEKTEPVQKATFKDKFTKCLSGPKQIIRSSILLTCTVVVVYQIGECLRKLNNPPISTYTHFDFNDTMKYPAITFCRDPPYKSDVLLENGLFAHPRYTSEWKHFDFENVDLDDFWKEATYSDKENVISVAIDILDKNVEVVNSLHFLLGQCQTLYPKVYPSIVSKETGYAVVLNHSMSEMDKTPSTIPPGYHVFVHETDEPFAEYLSVSLMEYVYVNVGEELEIKLGIQELNMLPNGPKKCQHGSDYSTNQCEQECKWKNIIKKVNCSGPWMNVDVPYCQNYTTMRDLIFEYMSSLQRGDCICQKRCKSSIYNIFVMDRNSMTIWNKVTGEWIDKNGPEKLQTQIHIYFNNKLISIYEENHSYDWSLFLADFGGSMGFLLGLSVVGVIVLLEDIFDSCIKPLVTSPPEEKESSVKKPNSKKISVGSEASNKSLYNNKRNIIDDYNRYNIEYGDKHFHI